MASRETDRAPNRRQGAHRPGAPGLTDLSAGDLRLLLNGEWEFAEGPDGDPPAAGWTRVRVPHRSREFEDEPPASGWYRTSIEVPDDWEIGERRLVLDPGRVRHFGRLYLDGQALGEHHGMRLPWRLDLTSLAAPGSTHDLLLYTHNCTGAYAHPSQASLSEDALKALDTLFWRTSAATVGLESDVLLSLESQVRIDDVHVTTSVRDGTITAALTVRNGRETPFAGQVRLRVRREGGTVLELPACEVEVPPGAAQRVSASASWRDPVIWGRPPYGEPVLYFLESSLHEAGSSSGPPVHAEVTRFGFREIWAEGDRLLLNGTRLMPWGDHTVPYVYERQWLTRKFVDLADANVSIVEHHRYDPPSVLYDVADELGVFVVGANFCVGTGQVFPPDMEAGEKALVMEHHLAVADHWMRSVRNHPSILFWDITDARDPEYCVPLLRKVKELDRSRIAEVTFDPSTADAELIELIDCYRLFSSLQSIEQSIETIRRELPVKPVRVGEAGIFTSSHWDETEEEQPPLHEGWEQFLPAMGERNIHGLQTFFFADMDYRGFNDSVPGMLAADFDFRVSWPSQSGADARIDPFSEGTPEARGKRRLSLNWCDPAQPVSRPTGTVAWSRRLFRRFTGGDVGPLAGERVPEVLVRVTRGGEPVPRACVVVAPLEGQAVPPHAVRADLHGTAWFVLPEAGGYRFTCEGAGVDVETRRQPVRAPAGYGHVQEVELRLSEDGSGS